MDKAILKFVNYNEKYLFNKSLLKKKLFAKGKGDLDFYDKNRQLRKSFETLSKREKYITIKRYHKTGLRIDVLNNNLDFRYANHVAIKRYSDAISRLRFFSLVIKS